MKKKKITKAGKKRLVVFGTISVFIIGYFLFTLFAYLYNLYDLKREHKQLDSALNELKRDEKLLNSEIDKLQDDEYIAKYARENYSYSKDGEYIIKINDKSKLQEDRKTSIFNIDYNYIIYSGVGVIGLVFIYIIKKKK